MACAHTRTRTRLNRSLRVIIFLLDVANHSRNATIAQGTRTPDEDRRSRRAITHVRLNYLPIDNRNTTTQPVPAKKGSLESCRCRIIKFLKTPLRIPSRESIHSLNISDTKNAPWPSGTDATEASRCCENEIHPFSFFFSYFPFFLPLSFSFREKSHRRFRPPSAYATVRVRDFNSIILSIANLYLLFLFLSLSLSLFRIVFI